MEVIRPSVFNSHAVRPDFIHFLTNHCFPSAINVLVNFGGENQSYFCLKIEPVLKLETPKQQLRTVVSFIRRIYALGFRINELIRRAARSKTG